MQKVVTICLFSLLSLLVTGCPTETTQSSQSISTTSQLPPLPLPPIFPECCVPCQTDIDCVKEGCDTAKKDGRCILGTSSIGLCAW